MFAAALLATAACGTTNPYQGMSADQLYDRALAEFEEEDWDDAVEVFTVFLASYPADPRAADARWRVAEAYFADERYITAEQSYLTFGDRHPGDPRASRAALGACKSLEALSPISQRDQTYTRRAMIVCANTAQDWAGIDDEVATEARAVVDVMRSKLGKKQYESAAQYADYERWDSAIIYFQLVLEEYPDTEWAPKAIVGLMEASAEIGYQDDVEMWRQRLLNSYPESPEARAILNGSCCDAAG